MELVERNDACRNLDRLYADARRGRGRVAVVNAAIGCGKTTLLHSFADRATVAGATVLSATCSHSERTFELGVVRQIVQTAAVGPVVDVDGLPGLSATLIGLAETAPLVVAVDDVGYADPASLQWLLYLARRLRSARILMVLTEPVDPSFEAELLRQPHCQRIRLAPLSPAGVARMIGDGAAAPEVHELTGGNPFLVSALMEDGAPGPTFGRAVVTLLYRAGPEFLKVAQAVAVLDEASSPETVGRLVKLDARAAARVERALTEAGVLRAGQFRHPAARAAVLDDLAGDNGPEVHREAARQLHGDGAPPTVVAMRLLAASRVDGPWAVPVLQESAEHALHTGQVQLAVRQLRLAYDGCVHDDQRAAIRLRLAGAEWRVKPSAVLRHLPELAIAVRERSLRGRDAVAAVRQMLWHGYPKDAGSALARFSVYPSDLDLETAAEAEATRLLMALFYPPLDGHAPPNGPASPGAAGHQLQAVSALFRVLTGGTDAAAASAEQVLERASIGQSTTGPAVAALLALVYADRLDRAESWSATLSEVPAVRDTPTWTAIVSAIRAEVALRRGDLPAAERLARSALDTISVRCWGVALGGPLSTLLRTATATGRHDVAAEILSRPVGDATFRTPFGLLYMEARGDHYLATGRPQVALAEFETCGELARRWNLDVPVLVPWRTGLARVHLALGQPAAAASVLREQLARIGDGPSPARGTSLRLLAATVEPAERPELLRAAIEVLEAGGNRLELAHALADLAAAGAPDAAGPPLRRALHLARECGSEALVRHLSAVEDDEPAGVDALSEAERRVALLVLDGLTNREIAGRLYVTISTVEQHLTRVYRKVGVTRRNELRRLLLPAGEKRNGTGVHGPVEARPFTRA